MRRARRLPQLQQLLWEGSVCRSRNLFLTYCVIDRFCILCRRALQVQSCSSGRYLILRNYDENKFAEFFVDFSIFSIFLHEMRPKKGHEVGVVATLSQEDRQKKAQKTAENRKQASKIRMRTYRKRKGITPRIKLTAE
eukprot:PhF_6_TR13695/c0_g1_i3/m.22085